jgi:hypothetical protein
VRFAPAHSQNEPVLHTAPSVPMTAGSPRAVPLPAAVLLCHALVAAAADRVGVRVLFVKGPTAQLQGLRSPRISSDTDVLVPEESLSALVAELSSRGWLVRPEDPDKAFLQPHSITLYSPSWPCDIDLHFRFPGMEEEWGAVFDRLWSRRTRVDVAHRAITVPSSGDHLGILLLNELRSRSDGSAQLDEIRDLAVERPHELLDFALGTGAVGPLRQVLELLPESQGVVYPRLSRNWRWHTRTSSDSARRIIAVLQAPWREKPRLVLHSVFAPLEVVRITDLRADASLRSLAVKNLQRWSRALTHLCGSLREVVHYFLAPPRR